MWPVARTAAADRAGEADLLRIPLAPALRVRLGAVTGGVPELAEAFVAVAADLARKGGDGPSEHGATESFADLVAAEGRRAAADRVRRVRLSEDDGVTIAGLDGMVRTGTALASEIVAVLEAAAADPLESADEILRRARRAQSRAVSPAASVLDGGMTMGQLLTWLAQELHPASPIYNMGTLVDLRPTVDAARLVEAIRSVVTRSDALSSAFRVGPRGLPVRTSVEYDEAWVETTNVPEEVAVEELAASSLQRAPDLGRGVFRSLILRKPSGRLHWLFSIHHIATDGWSNRLFFDLVTKTYEGRAAECSPFAAIVDEERRYRSSPQADGDRDYWSARLEQIDATRVRWLRAPGTARDTRVDRMTAKVDEAVVAELGGRGKATIGVEFGRLASLVAAAAVVVGALTDERLVSVGVPFHNRGTPARRATLGLLMEIVPVVLELDPSVSAASLASLASAALLDAARHSRHSVGNPRGAAYDVVVNYQPFPFPPFHGRARVTWPHAGYGVEALCLGLRDYGGGWVLDVDANVDLFAPAVARRLVGAVAELLHAVAREPKGGSLASLQSSLLASLEA